MSIIRAIEKYYNEKFERNWSVGYWFIDLHGTVLKPNYQYSNITKEFYPYAKETLQLISSIPDIIMVMYTCSHPNEIEVYLNFFKENNINFKYVNENPEVPTDVNGYGCYDKKPYMNVLFDDKASFDPYIEWKGVLELMQSKYGTLKK